MLTALIQSTGKPVIADNVSKVDGPFVCRGCQGEAIIKKGLKVMHHFAHKPDADCPYKGESEEHMAAKMAVYDALSALDHLEVEMEKPMGGNRADVYAKVKETGVEVAIELQLSNLTAQEIIDRTANYRRLGIYVLWLPFWSEFEAKIAGEDEIEGRYRAYHWERWLHKLNDGLVFYWVSGVTVRMVKFKDYYLSSGRKSRKWRTPVVEENDLNILADFEAADVVGGADSWSKVWVPPAKILRFCYYDTSETFLSPQERAVLEAERAQYEIQLAERQRVLEEERAVEAAERKRIADWVELAYFVGEWQPAEGEVEALSKSDPALLQALQAERKRREDEKRWAEIRERDRIRRELNEAMRLEEERKESEQREQKLAKMRRLWRKATKSRSFIESLAGCLNLYGGSLTEKQEAAIDKMFVQFGIS